MSYQSDNLDLEILEVGDPADLTTVSDNFDKIDAVAGDIATVETSPTQAAHSIGEFLLYGGHLYKVTSPISSGGSLILGTNVRAANIGSELKSLQDSVTNPTVSITLNSGYEYTDLKARKCGKIINVIFDIKATADIPTNARTTLGTMLINGSPAPKWIVTATACSSAVNGLANRVANLLWAPNSGGTLLLDNHLPNAGIIRQIYVDITYCIN